MSSQPPFVDPPPAPFDAAAASSRPVEGGGVSASKVGDITHIQYLSDDIGALYLNDEYSDITLVVEGSSFRAHRVILAARSRYFRALLFGGMKESRLSEVELKDTPLPAFRQLLRYIYTGSMSLCDQKDDLILDVLGLSHQYGFSDLEFAISEYLKAILSVANVANIYDTASLFQLRNLVLACYGFMDRNATEVVQHESFSSLSASGAEDVISRDSFCAPEADIFKAVCRWVRCNPAGAGEGGAAAAASTQRILRSVRLSLMSTQDLLKVVRPTGLVPPDVMLDAIQSRTECRDMELKYRGYLIPEENVCTPQHDAVVIQGEVKQALLDGDTRNYDMDHGFTRHSIDDGLDAGGIVIRLGTQYIINHVRLLLWDRELRRSYSYVIDVSMDQKDWVRVIDHSKFHCRTWQNLYFAPRVVRYIRITGTYNSVNKVFHAVSLEVYYTKKPFELDEHSVVVPKENVATIPKHAIVKEGVCRTRNALLNEDTSNYNWDSGYTCHQLGSGSIVVQLGQPYALDSMRLLLWDCDDRSYSYYVEVSRNEKDWEVICDRSQVPCRSWQTIAFPRRPIVYIRIVGTQNTANEVFHCVHFECPSVTLQPPQTLPREVETSSSSSDDEGEDVGGGGGDDGKPPKKQKGKSSTPKDDSSSTVANCANLQEEEEEDDGIDGAGAADEMSHHSSPASYAGSVAESSSGIRANNSLPVGASACSIARRGSPSSSGSSPSSPPPPPPPAASSSSIHPTQRLKAAAKPPTVSPFGSAQSLPANVASSDTVGSASSSPGRRVVAGGSFEDPLPSRRRRFRHDGASSGSGGAVPRRHAAVSRHSNSGGGGGSDV